MKKSMLTGFVAFFILGAVGFFHPPQALSNDVGFSIGINIGAPMPRVIVTRPPAVYLVPGTPVYYAPEFDRELFFYSGSWYRIYDGYFYRAAYYGGPWIFMSPDRVPLVFFDFSPNYYITPIREIYAPYWKHRDSWMESERHRYNDRYDRRERHRRQMEWRYDGWREWKEDKREHRRHH